MFSARYREPCSVAKWLFPVNARDATVSYLLRQFAATKAIEVRMECDALREIVLSTNCADSSAGALSRTPSGPRG
jgi:hypothetical protein